MGFVKEFKDFAVKGNAIDLAIATVLGGAFNAIVGSIVDSILMPIVGILTGGVNFNELAIKVGDAQLKYGLAIAATVKFIIVALFLFMVIKGLNSIKKKEAAAAPAPPKGPTQEELLTEIRDLLKK
jgi:large conductance mechanosensitive channel